MKIGIVGLPNVGKSTLYNALTRSEVPAENFPFTTIDPHEGRVAVPDPRLGALASLVHPARTVPAAVGFVDIAGLLRGASQGEGLGNQFLSHIREADAVAMVVRCFAGEVHHVEGSVDPARDLETIETELALADLATVERRRADVERRAKADASLNAELELLRRLESGLGAGSPARAVLQTSEERAYTQKQLGLLTAKPLIYVANIDESPDPLLTAPVRGRADAEGAPFVQIAARLEAELNELSEEEIHEYLAGIGQERTGLEQLIQTGYGILGLQTFFTAGPKEVRAWTVRVGASAPEAAGVIHTDFEKHFIRAEVISYDDYIASGGEAAARGAGRLRAEGRDYRLRDGDVVHFRTSA